MPIKNLMKTIVIFYDEDSKYSKEKAFKGKSAVELTNEWAQSLNLPSFTVKSATLTDLLCDMKEICSKENAENVVFSFIDLPLVVELGDGRAHAVEPQTAGVAGGRDVVRADRVHLRERADAPRVTVVVGIDAALICAEFRELLKYMAGDKNSYLLFFCKFKKHLSYVDDTLRIQSVDWFIKYHKLRLCKKRHSNSKSLSHS